MLETEAWEGDVEVGDNEADEDKTEGELLEDEEDKGANGEKRIGSAIAAFAPSWWALPWRAIRPDVTEEK